MAQNLSKQLAEARDRVTRLEQAVAERNKRISGLHVEYGFETVDEFIAALKSSASARGVVKRSADPLTADTGAQKASSGTRVKRAKITSEVKERVKALVKDGVTGGKIAKELGISLPSVHNIKKEFGLTKARGK